ncbi:MAG TPA: hypothetical protein DCQ06_08000, partial [Myxococcales bacterium]|nr:hypothetical protein [Myxococcales bacterium]
MTCSAIGMARIVLATVALMTCSLSYADIPGIPPGREQDILALFAPFGDEQPITPEATLLGVEVSGFEVRVIVSRNAPNTSRAIVRMRPKDLSDQARHAFTLSSSDTEDLELQKAMKLLSQAITKNDDGSFFHPGKDQVVADAPTFTPLHKRPLVWVSGLLWLLLLSLMARLMSGSAQSFIRRGQTHQQLTLWVCLVVLLAASLWWRRTQDWTPLHANNHAWEDLAVLLDQPETQMGLDSQMRTYGPSWFVLRRALTSVFGANFEIVGLIGVWLGAFAALLAWLATRAAGGGWISATVATAAITFAPISTRVAHSESDLIVGQWLMAAGLWLGTRPGLWGLVGAGCCVALMALGHVVGLAFAGALALMVLSLRASLSESSHGQNSQSWLVDATVLASPVIGVFGLRWLAMGQEVSQRMQATSQAIPVPDQ